MVVAYFKTLPQFWNGQTKQNDEEKSVMTAGNAAKTR
jgi:hypothetical protein